MTGDEGTMGAGPARRVVVVADPATEAVAYAERLGADVADDRASVEREVDARAVAARRIEADPPSADDGDTVDLLARADAIRAAAAATPLGDLEIAELRLRAAELARAGRIRAHTEARFEEVMAATRSDPLALAVHPETILDAAAEVVAAERRLGDAEEARSLTGTAPLPFAAPDTDPSPRPQGTRPGILARLLERLGVDRRATEPADGDGDGDRDGSVDELARERDEAAEEVRLARRRWHGLAGADADPYAPDVAVRPHDPQLAYDDHTPEPSPTVLAVAAFHRKAQARWRVLWAAAGGGEPPEPEQLDVALEGLAVRRRRAIAELSRLERIERRATATTAVARPLVVVEPDRWASADELRRLLAPLPPSSPVIVLERRAGGEPIRWPVG